jgi:RNA polymerase sigma factor (sigma-70 family)
MGFVKRGMRTAGLSEDDMHQEAMIALYRAAKDFDPSRGYKFSTLAWAYILNAVRRVVFRDFRAKGGTRSTAKGAKRVATVRSIEGDEQLLEELGYATDPWYMTQPTDSHEDRVVEQLEGEWWMREALSLCPNEETREIFLRSMGGESYVKLAKAYGVSRQRIHQRIGPILIQLKNYTDGPS